MDWIISIIKKCLDDKYSGKLEINFFNGGIADVHFDFRIKHGEKITITK